MRVPGLGPNLAVRAGRRLPPNVKRLVNAARGIDMPRVVDRPEGRRVAVLAPHPDDELIGCGGTIQKHLHAGDEVTVVLMTSGERTASFVGQSTDDRRSQRDAEAVAGCAEVGLRPEALRFLRLPDGGIGQDGRGDLVAALTGPDPDLVYTPNPIDAHRDHVATTRLLGDSLATLPGVGRVALYEVWTPIYPNVIVDVSAGIDAKIRGLQRYASAMDVVDYTHTVRGLAAYRAGHGLHGRGYAEAFCVLEREAFLELLDRLA